MKDAPILARKLNELVGFATPTWANESGRWLVCKHKVTELALNVVGDNSLDEAEVESTGGYVEVTDGKDIFEQRAVRLSLPLLDSWLVKSPALKGKAGFGQTLAEALEGGGVSSCQTRERWSEPHT